MGLSIIGRPIPIKVNMRTINYFAAISLIIVSFISCENQSSEQKSFNQLDQLSNEDINKFKTSIIRYIGRKPENADHQMKFNAHFNEHYEEQIQLHELVNYYKNKEEKEFFLVTRIAPSIKLKKVAIGGWVKRDAEGKTIQIEEVFRTWKHEPDTLIPRAEMLFAKMVNQEDLTPYYTENHGTTKYIEFPNQEVYYDTLTKTWLSEREDVLEEFKKQKIEQTKKELENN